MLALPILSAPGKWFHFFSIYQKFTKSTYFGDILRFQTAFLPKSAASARVSCKIQGLMIRT
jgi:hypothetical protein